VRAIGTNVSGVQGDVAQLADLDRLYETVSKVKGRIDIVFANAGVGEFVPFGAVTEEHFDKLFNINVRGTLLTVQKALPLLKDGGSIILNGSVAGLRVLPPSASTPRVKLQSALWIRYSGKPKFPRSIRMGDWIVDCMKDGATQYVGPPVRMLAQEEWASSRGTKYAVLIIESPTHGESMTLSQFRKKVRSIESKLGCFQSQNKTYPKQ
jgi:NAD(P)-dependent dehydrogenase (short-subunit alcohol dehydrogenase family)